MQLVIAISNDIGSKDCSIVFSSYYRSMNEFKFDYHFTSQNQIDWREAGSLYFWHGLISLFVFLFRPIFTRIFYYLFLTRGCGVSSFLVSGREAAEAIDVYQQNLNPIIVLSDILQFDIFKNEAKIACLSIIGRFDYIFIICLANFQYSTCPTPVLGC